MKVARLSVLCTGHLYPQEIFLVLTSVRGWVNPRSIVQPEGLRLWKMPMTPSGIDPATFQFVVQCLSHCTTACPTSVLVLFDNLEHFIIQYLYGHVGAGVNPALLVFNVKGVETGFGGLVVSMLASGTQDRGFAPDQSCQERNPQHSFLRRGSKTSVPCPSFGACKRT
jgi:hypothetical protein